MSAGKMGFDPSLAVAGARRTLRRLELEAYASVMTAFRAQGPLTQDKKCSLEQLGKLLGISSERHRAEARRAVNDELLSAVASCVCPTDSEEMWQREGQKLASTNPRFVARQLTHLPHLLTSATVSGALNLQSPRSDTELKKNTSTQVQNVLKFIISQNPLNSGSVPGGGVAGGAGGGKGKLTVPTSLGKPLVKSPSKLLPSGEGSGTTTVTGSQSTTTTTSNTSSPAKSPGKTSIKEEKLSKSEPITSPSKTPLSGRENLDKPPTTGTDAPSSTLEKPSKTTTSGKSSMLMGLLEVKKVEDTSNDSATALVDTGKKEMETAQESDEKREDEVVESKEEEKSEETKVDRETEKMEVDEKEEKEEEREGRNSEVGPNNAEISVGETKIEQTATEVEQKAPVSEPEKESSELKAVLENEHTANDESHTPPITNSEVGTSQTTNTKSSELECEAAQPEVGQTKEVDVTQTKEDTITPSEPEPSLETERISESKPDDVNPQETVKETDTERHSSTPPPVEQKEPEHSESDSTREDENKKEEEEAGNDMTLEVEPCNSSSNEKSEIVHESRKRHLSCDVSLPPSPKKAHIDALTTEDTVSSSSHPSAPLTLPPPSLSLPAPLPSLPPPTSVQTPLQPATVVQPPLSLTPPVPPVPPRATIITTPIKNTTAQVQATYLQESPLPVTQTMSTMPVISSVPPPPPPANPPTSTTERLPVRSREEERAPREINVVIRQIGPGAPVGRVGGVTIQPLLPASIPLPSVNMTLSNVSSSNSNMAKSLSQVSAPSPAAFMSQATSPPPPPPPLSTLVASSLPSLTHPLSTTNSKATPPTPPTSLSLPKSNTSNASSTQKSPAGKSNEAVTLQEQPSISNDVMMMSSSSDEALIKELCSEAAEDTTAADLASQLGLEYLEPNLLGGLDFMQLVNSPLEEVKPGSESPLIPGLSISNPSSLVTPTGDAPDTSQLLSEALTSLSNPSTPLLSSSIPGFHSPHFVPTSPLFSLQSPAQQPPTSLLASPATPASLHPLPSSLATQTPPTYTPHTPSLTSPLTPEILPDIQNLANVNEADLLEGIPPELAETIQALAQLNPLQ